MPLVNTMPMGQVPDSPETGTRRSTLQPAHAGPGRVIYGPPVAGKSALRDRIPGSADTDDYIAKAYPEWFEDKLYLAMAGQGTPSQEERARRIHPLMMRAVTDRAAQERPPILLTNLPKVARHFADEGVPTDFYAFEDASDAVERMRERGDDTPAHVAREWHLSARDFVSGIGGSSHGSNVRTFLLRRGQYIGEDGPIGEAVEQASPFEPAAAGAQDAAPAGRPAGDDPEADSDTTLADIMEV